jgi:ABC-type Fe3+ transport system permease subunit
VHVAEADGNRTRQRRGTPPPSKLQRMPSIHDGLAITAFILAWFMPLLGFILGCVSIGSAHRDGRNASGLAIAGAVIGGLATVIIVIVIIAILGSQPDALQQYLNCLNNQLNNPDLVCTRHQAAEG